jgi:uncharacterized protein YcgL (UPF0745 family)
VARDSLSNAVNKTWNMKAIIFIIGLSAGLLGQSLAQTSQPESPTEGANEISSDDLATKLGMVYHKFRIERVEPAGITISYLLEGGGLGMETIPFSMLPEDWQRRYGYDPEKAAETDLDQKRAMAQLRVQMVEDTLITKLGTVYHKFIIERVDPSGITISYVLDSGALEMETVPFSLLPDDWQRRYGYNPKKAAAFALEQKRAMAQLREQMIADEQAYREKRAKEEAEEAAKQAAAAAQATNAPAITDTNQLAAPLPPGGH